MSVTRKNILQHLGQQPEEEQEKEEDEEEEFLPSDSNITLVLEVMGLMCDGQFRCMQDYLREQPELNKVC